VKVFKSSFYQFNDLATYNSERARGIVHTPEWVEKMAEQQRLFDDGQRAWMTQNGVEVIGD
jgi:hypothetical protein